MSDAGKGPICRFEVTGGEATGRRRGGVTDRQPGQEGAGAEGNAGKTQDSAGKF